MQHKLHRRAPPANHSNQPANTPHPPQQQHQPSQAAPSAQNPANSGRTVAASSSRNAPAASSQPANASRAPATSSPSTAPSSSAPPPKSSSNPTTSSTISSTGNSNTSGNGQFGASDSASNGSNSNTTAIVAGVCASIGAVILILIVWRFLKRRRSSVNKVPLPPVQEIAHFREQDKMRQLSANSRPMSTWNSSAGTDVDSTFAPFLKAGDLSPGLMSPADTSYSSLSASPSPPELDRHSPVPASASTVSPPKSSDTMSSSSTSTTHVQELGSGSTSPDFTHPQRNLNHSISQSTLRSTRSRALSYARSNGTGYRSGNTPHSIYGNVQIVLPAPLATQSPPSSFVPSENAARRATIVDAWTSHTVLPQDYDGRNVFADP